MTSELWLYDHFFKRFEHFHIFTYQRISIAHEQRYTGIVALDIYTFKDLFDWYVQYLNTIITFRLNYQNGTQLSHLFLLIRHLKSKYLKQLHTCMIISTHKLYKLGNCGNALWKNTQFEKKKLSALNLGPNQCTLIKIFKEG